MKKGVFPGQNFYICINLLNKVRVMIGHLRCHHHHHHHHHRHHPHHHDDHLVDGNIGKPGSKIAIGSIAANVQQLLPRDHPFQLLMMVMMMMVAVVMMMMMLVMMMVMMTVVMIVAMILHMIPLRALRHLHKG